MEKPLNISDFVTTMREVTQRMGTYSDWFMLAGVMVVAHESKGGTYWVQQGGGPALGIIQMEGWVHDDVWKNCDKINEYAKRLGITKDVNSLKTSIAYNIFMMRCRFIMDVNPFPTDIVAMAEYVKAYWNSNAGKASSTKYLDDFLWWTLYGNS